MMPELRLRQIENGKPVAIIRIVPGKGVFRRAVEEEECDFVACDFHFVCSMTQSFDLGINLNGEWWFEGDMGYDIYREEFTFYYEHHRARWCIDYPDGDTYSEGNMLEGLSGAKHIGTIYDKDK